MDNARVPDAPVPPAIHATAPLPLVTAAHTLFSQLPRGLTASKTSTLALPLNSEVAACGAPGATTTTEFPILTCGAHEIEYATPACAGTVWPDAQVARVGSVVTVVDVTRLTFPQLAIAAIVPIVTLTFTRAFIICSRRGEDGLAVRPTVNMLSANCRRDGRAAVKVRRRNARAAVAVAAPRLPRSDGRFCRVGAILRRSVTFLAETVTAVAGRGICLRPLYSIDVELAHFIVIRKRLLDVGELICSCYCGASGDAESCLVVFGVPFQLVVVHTTAPLSTFCAPPSWAAPVGRPDETDRQVYRVSLASIMSRDHCGLCEGRRRPWWAALF